MILKIMTNYLFCGHRVILVVILCLFGLCTVWSGQPVRKKRTGTPPAPKYEDNRVYLLHSDELSYNKYINPDAQILNGNVSFRHQGATLYCDSAHFYENTNSFEAFNNVKMYQGDTLSLFSDYAYYDGNEQMCQARYNVVLKNRESTLYTDSLNFDRLYGIGYFFEGGKLVDNGSVLTSDWGEYNTGTKMALFNYSVKLRGKDYVLTSDTLYYDMNISRAHVLGPSEVVSGSSRIYTEDGYYNTKSEQAELYGRSVVRDGGKVIIGDSVYYDKVNGTSEAFGNVVYTDTVNRNRLTGDYCFYNEQTGYGMSTKRAVAMDFSQADTLYMHADTFKIYTFNINTDSVYRKLHAYNRVRAYRTDVQAVCDSMVFNSQDSCLTMYRDPIVWNLSQQLLGEVIKVYMRDSTIDRAHVIGQALSVEQMPDSVHYNQVASREMFAFFRNGEIYEAEADDNVLIVYYPVDESDSMLIGLNYTETSKLRMFLENRKMKRIWMPKAEGTLYPMSQIPPERKFLPNYAWFDYIRPIDKNDIFNWRGKKAGTELKEEKRREAPLRRFGDNGSAADKEPAGAGTAVSEPAEQDETPANKSEQTTADGDIL
ncbi:OstA-like protein [Xylanibacter rodentium]|uniref:OstA-like protein n=1 Tax=Xylanibacter rodentium TaxID=2736289 RepID=UPI0039790751